MSSKPPEYDPQQMSEQMKNSAQQIWQAGLGAFAKAQEEGSKIFEALVKDGSKLQETTMQAQAKMAEAAAKANDLPPPPQKGYIACQKALTSIVPQMVNGKWQPVPCSAEVGAVTCPECKKYAAQSS